VADVATTSSRIASIPAAAVSTAVSSAAWAMYDVNCRDPDKSWSVDSGT